RSRIISCAPATAATYPLSLHDALPICGARRGVGKEDRAMMTSISGRAVRASFLAAAVAAGPASLAEAAPRMTNAQKQQAEFLCQDRKSTRLNSSHVKISYAVFCLKKKN